MATQFKYIKSDNTEGMVTASSAEEAIKTAPDRLATSGVQAIPQAPTAPVIPVDSAMGAVQTLPQVDNRPLPTATAGSVQGAITTAAMPPVEPVKEDTTARGKMESLASKIFGGGQDVAAEREQLRIDAQTREKEAQARLLGNKLTARQRDIQKGLEAIEANPRGKTEYALNTEINKYNRETARELADLSFSYNVALGDYQAAEKIVSERLSDIQAQRSQDIQAFNTLFNFVQNDMTESEKLQAQQAFQEKQNETNFAQQKELMAYENTLKQADPMYQAQLKKLQSEAITLNQQEEFFKSLFGVQTSTEPAMSFEDYVEISKDGKLMSYTPEAISQLRAQYDSQMTTFTQADPMQKITQAVMMGVINPQQANFMIENLNISTPQQQQRQAGVIETGRGVLRDIDRALGLVDSAGVGIRSVASQQFASTDSVLGALVSAPFAKDTGVELAQHLESVKSNLSIEELQKMRENSPTGGALGQVPVKQQEYLMSMKGSLKVNMPATALKENLNDLYNIYLDAMFGSPEELSSAVQKGRMTAAEANSYLKARKQSSYDEFNLPTSASMGRPIDNLIIAPDGRIIQIK
jgi:hypothetical protein